MLRCTSSVQLFQAKVTQISMNNECMKVVATTATHSPSFLVVLQQKSWANQNIAYCI